MKRVLAVLAVLASFLIGRAAWAEVYVSNAVSVSNVSATVTFPRPLGSVLVVSSSSSAATAYFRLFACGDTVAAATTSYIPLVAGAGKSYSYDVAGAQGAGYCALTIITASSTASVSVEGQ